MTDEDVEASARPARGSLSLYVLAWVFLAVAVAALALSVAGFLESTGLLVLSAVLSGLATASALVGLALPRRP